MKLRKTLKIYVILSFLIFNLVGCQTGVPKEALMLSPESIADRQLQTRVFETNDEMKLLAASAAVLQDLGFSIDQSESGCGVIVSSRDTTAAEAAELMSSRLFIFMMGHKQVRFFASLVTKPLYSKRIAVRITFKLAIVDKDRLKGFAAHKIIAPELYQSFFSELSKSVFLVAHEI